MNFDLSPEERTFQSQARAYLQEVTGGWNIPLDDEEYEARARVVREGLGEREWLTLGWGPPYGPASTCQVGHSPGRAGLPPGATGQ